jgi:hypothetical protein
MVKILTIHLIAYQNPLNNKIVSNKVSQTLKIDLDLPVGND